jgi:hypothetical protein
LALVGHVNCDESGNKFIEELDCDDDDDDDEEKNGGVEGEDGGVQDGDDEDSDVEDGDDEDGDDEDDDNDVSQRSVVLSQGTIRTSVKTVGSSISSTKIKQYIEILAKTIIEAYSSGHSRTIEMLWIGCKDIMLVMLLIAHLKTKNISVRITILEDIRDIIVPHSMINYITVLKLDFLYFEGHLNHEKLVFYDIMYSSVSGSISSIFQLKYFAFAFFYYFKECLLIGHPALFEVLQCEGDINKKAKRLLPKHVTQLIKETDSKKLKYIVVSEKVFGTYNAGFGLQICKVNCNYDCYYFYVFSHITLACF